MPVSRIPDGELLTENVTAIHRVQSGITVSESREGMEEKKK
jgi:hypothetical protein